MNLEGIEELLEQAKVAAIAAGVEILKVYENGDYEVDLKENQSPLTTADRLGHKIINDFLAGTSIPVLSEEGRDISYEERKDWKTYWLVDPLDGTKEFVKRNGEFTVNIALIVENSPVFGVVYTPVLKDLYYGGKHLGAFKENASGQAESLPISKSDTVEVIVASRSHLSDETKEFIDNYPGVQMISMGSSLKFLLVAEGRAQLYPRFAPTMEWDTAAAQAIVEGSGGVVMTYPGLELMSYNKPNLLNEWFIVKALGH